MTLRIENARLVREGRIEPHGTLLLRDGLIAEIGGEGACDRILNAAGALLLPGFVDIHCHGGGGFDFMDATPEEMRAISDFHLSYGTTTLVATTMTDSPAHIEEMLDRFAALGEDRGTLHGVHLEGPWLSPLQCGAQSVNGMEPPTPKALQRLLTAYPFIERVSLAPERDEGYATCKHGVAAGRVMAMAHTDADFDGAVAAADAGCRLVTHLYSGIRGVVRKNAYRVAGAVEAALVDDRMTVEVISDGKHLPAGLLKLIYKCKGAGRICLVTDAMRGAGLPMGSRTVLGRLDGGNEVILEDGVAKLPDRTAFAGSVATADRLLRTMVKEAGVPLPEASRMLSETPARVMGYTDRGRIAPGQRADLVLLNDDYQIQHVIWKGELIK